MHARPKVMTPPPGQSRSPLHVEAEKIPQMPASRKLQLPNTKEEIRIDFSNALISNKVFFLFLWLIFIVKT